MIIIKETETKDLDFLCDLWNNGEVMKWVGFPQGLGKHRDDMNPWFDAISKSGSAKHYSIYNDSQFSGETFYRIKDDIAYVDIKLDPKFHGKGIASYALSFCMTQIFINFPNLKVQVDPRITNTQAINLYTRLGFKPTGEFSTEVNQVFTCALQNFKPSQKYLSDAVKIVDFKEADLENVYKLAYEQPHYRFEDFDAPYFGKEERKTFEEFTLYYHERYINKASLKAIKLEDKLVGSVSSYYVDSRTRWLEIGILLYEEDMWNKSIGKIALRQWITHIFNTHNIEHIGLSTWSGNQRMMKSALNVGLNLEAHIPKVRYYQDYYYDSLKYGITRSEWFSKQEQS
ncbi:MAG: GNAT family N-acetyltransferase [Erysipelotrichia bacterium]|jgi:RimJ/RimL family protein N-acetyltransferase|nr:GNAT family N-acetyltransferase [Erysipelotrichia bacterium]